MAIPVGRRASQAGVTATAAAILCLSLLSSTSRTTGNLHHSTFRRRLRRRRSCWREQGRGCANVVRLVGGSSIDNKDHMELQGKIKNMNVSRNQKSSTSAGTPDEIDPKVYRSQRLQSISEAEMLGFETYPHYFPTTMQVADYVKVYDDLKDGQRLNKTERIAGRVTSVRSSSKKLLFFDLEVGGSHVQVMSDRRMYRNGEDFEKDNKRIHRGDIIGVEGHPGRSRRGELSIFPTRIQVLAPCLHMIPKGFSGIKELESRYRQRYLDLICNNATYNVFRTRAKIIKYLRNFLEDRGFMEVETPILTCLPGGANAKPFVTFHNAMNITQYLRVAPELYLKQLVIGGLERVFEIGRNFRNEGVDTSHNPEFTACEFYQAYADYNELMNTTETLLSEMVKAITGSYKISYHNSGEKDEPVEIDFTPPFKRIPMIPTLESMTNETFPMDLAGTEANRFMSRLCDKHNLSCSAPRTTARLLDKLVGHFLENRIVSPCFITEHPTILSPLAKGHRAHPNLTERFELFVAGKEIANAYTELNDPRIQRARFQTQEMEGKQGDDEAQVLDESFCTALEYGLPPTAGWGLGIDRLVMLLTDRHSIKEVLLFPTMKPL